MSAAQRSLLREVTSVSMGGWSRARGVDFFIHRAFPSRRPRHVREDHADRAAIHVAHEIRRHPTRTLGRRPRLPAPLCVIHYSLPVFARLLASASRSRGECLEGLTLRWHFCTRRFSSGTKGLYGNSCRCLWVRLCVCNASVCTDHEVYVVAVIVSS